MSNSSKTKSRCASFARSLLVSGLVLSAGLLLATNPQAFAATPPKQTNASPKATSATSSSNSTGLPATGKPVVAVAGLLVAPLLNQTPIIAPVKVNFTDCGPKNIKDVRITPCPGDGNVCNINLGTNVTVEADFIAKHEASSLSELIQGVIRGRELQFPEQRADPCKSTISPGCPIKISKHYQYKAIFEIKPYYPAIPVKVRYALLNQNGDVVACVQIAAKIVDPSPSVRSSRNKAKLSSNKKP